MSKSIAETVHKAATDLFEVGAIHKRTMREFDALCLAPIKKLSANQIKRLRLRKKVSQNVFAVYLNASIATVHAWEQGQKSFNSPSLKLLNLVNEKGIDILA